MEDIQHYTSAELSLRFFNTEYLYNEMRDCCECDERLRLIADEHFRYSEEQFQELARDWLQDAIEQFGLSIGDVVIEQRSGDRAELMGFTHTEHDGITAVIKTEASPMLKLVHASYLKKV